MVVDSSPDEAVDDLPPGWSRGGPRCARPWPWSRRTSDQGNRRRRGTRVSTVSMVCRAGALGGGLTAVGALGGAKRSANCSPDGAWGSAMEGWVPR
jgi:hypothetical protein